MEEFKLEVIGYFDVIRFYWVDFEIMDLIWEKIVRNIDLGIFYGVLFEINISGVFLRKKLKYLYFYK